MSHASKLQNAGLLSEFGKFIGLPDLSFDKSRTCTLSFDETVIFLREENDGSLIVYAPLLEVPEDNKATIQTLLLNANFMFQGTRGATMSMAEHSSFATIAVHMKPFSLSLKALTEVVEEFLKLVDFWQDKLSKIIVSDGGQATADSGEEVLTARRGLKA